MSIPLPISTRPAAAQITNSPNTSSNNSKITTTRLIWRVFKIVYLEVIQTLILTILWFVAFRKGFPPTGFEWFILLNTIVSLIGVAFYKCYNHWPDAVANNAKRTDTFSTTLQSVDDLDRKSPIVKVTGFRLFCTVLPLGLTLAKYALSAGDNSVSSNELDLVGYVVGSIVLVWMGYYSESHETFAPWFFHDDYSQIVFRGLGVLVIFCVAGIVASLLIPLYAIDRIPPVIILPGFVNMINVPLNEQRLYVCIAWAFGLHVAFIVLEGGLFLSIRSAERPMGGQILKWTCRFNSINAILCICLRFWRESDIQSFLHFLTLYERIGVKKLLFRTSSLVYAMKMVGKCIDHCLNPPTIYPGEQQYMN